MNKILKDILSLKIEPHLDKLDYLVLVASFPEEDSIHKGIQYISELSNIIRKTEKIKKSDDSMEKSNRLASFFNYGSVFTLHVDKKTDNIFEILEKMLKNGVNSSSSLSITLLHNAIAYKLGFGDIFKVFSDNNYYAPYFSDEGCKYSIFLHNCENKGTAHRFKNAKTISNTETISRFAGNMSSTPELESSKKEFLIAFSKKILEFKNP